jgi:D-tyrosyl-tRNA(Tyr) deacylase
VTPEMRETDRVRACIQRVSQASVTVDGATVASVGRGLLILVGVAAGDDERDADALAIKSARLRIFEDDDRRLDRSIVDIGGEALVVSQFTLVADVARGNRPSFSGAAPHERARAIFERFCATLASQGVPVATGVFGARMSVELVNDGPVTFVVG